MARNSDTAGTGTTRTRRSPAEKAQAALDKATADLEKAKARAEAAEKAADAAQDELDRAQRFVNYAQSNPDLPAQPSVESADDVPEMASV